MTTMVFYGLLFISLAALSTNALTDIAPGRRTVTNSRHETDESDHKVSGGVAGGDRTDVRSVADLERVIAQTDESDHKMSGGGAGGDRTDVRSVADLERAIPQTDGSEVALITTLSEVADRRLAEAALLSISRRKREADDDYVHDQPSHQAYSPSYPAAYPKTETFGKGSVNFQKLLDLYRSKYRHEGIVSKDKHYPKTPVLTFVKGFKPGKSYIEKGKIVRNYYRHGTYKVALQHFKFIPVIKVVPFTTYDTVGYSRSAQSEGGYTAAICKDCYHGYPKVDVTSRHSPDSYLTRRFVYLPEDFAIDGVIQSAKAIGEAKQHRYDSSQSGHGPLGHGHPENHVSGGGDLGYRGHHENHGYRYGDRENHVSGGGDLSYGGHHESHGYRYGDLENHASGGGGLRNYDESSGSPYGKLSHGNYEMYAKNEGHRQHTYGSYGTGYTKTYGGAYPIQGPAGYGLSKKGYQRETNTYDRYAASPYPKRYDSYPEIYGHRRYYSYGVNGYPKSDGYQNYRGERDHQYQRSYGMHYGGVPHVRYASYGENQHPKSHGSYQRSYGFGSFGKSAPNL